MIGVLRYCAAAIAVLSAATLSVADATAQSAAPAPKPAIWRVTDHDSTLWIFGSLHNLQRETTWRRPEIDTALAEASAVYFEVPLDYFSMTAARFRSQNAGLNPPGVRLTDMLAPEMEAHFRRVAKDLGLPENAYQRLAPWTAALTIDGLAAQRLGVVRQTSVDAILQADARRDRKDVRFLETLDEQLAIFTGSPVDAQIDMLGRVLVAYDENPTLFEDLVASWRSGDFEDMHAQMSALWPEAIYRRLIIDRNAKWAATLKVYMAGEGSALVVVGAAHVAGEHSLVKQLAAQGYAVERF